MSYVQGTKVRLEASFKDPETRAPVTPDEVRLTIAPPTGEPYVKTLSAGELTVDGPGRFSYVLDTSPAPGTWRYEFASVGQEAVVDRKALTVTKRLVGV